MTDFSNYIVYFMIFSPLVAAIFITLIPTVDLSSKITLSRFFASFGFLSFLSVLALFINNQLMDQYTLSVKLLDFYINISIIISKYNIFLFGAMATSLLANMILYELNDTKSNAHQVAPFILTFILFIILGQRDLRVMLPILSMSNFTIYFLIGYSDKIRRSSTIFHMGIFLFTIDALVLVLLQYQEIEGPDSLVAQSMKAVAIIAGLARLGLPICAPFMQNLFINTDEAEGPFLISYLHLSGFAILILIRSELGVVPDNLLSLVMIISLLSSLYLALAAVFEQRASIISYYSLTFYASITAVVIFFTDINIFWHLSAALLLSNIICFFHCSKSALLLSQYPHLFSLHPHVKATWFLSLCLLVGIPGFGIGASLWPTIYFFLRTPHDINPYWLLLFLASLLIITFALLLSYKRDMIKNHTSMTSIIERQTPLNNLFYFSPFIIAVITLLIPFATHYIFSRALS